MSERVSVAVRVAWVALGTAALGGCAASPLTSLYRATDERECLARVMYFESLRSSEDGMLAVGTVVMNRIDSGRYPKSVCGVVGQTNQFAPGALSNVWGGKSKAVAEKVADDVLGGARHPGLPKSVMFFHTAGLHFPYRNMHYILVAGGNAFYEKVSTRRVEVAQADPPEATLAYSEPSPPSQSPLASEPVAASVQPAADAAPDTPGLY